ncbi:phage tail tape measure protein [Silvanigrella sp.]|jgi:TP901 family phage tail tape measure protein|uniref:phage tail tape measure protein n=1 Tax=Silvanigrella sp. TaxID=2024976 RepID=UPI0037CAEF52
MTTIPLKIELSTIDSFSSDFDKLQKDFSQIANSIKNIGNMNELSNLGKELQNLGGGFNKLGTNLDIMGSKTKNTFKNMFSDFRSNLKDLKNGFNDYIQPLNDLGNKLTSAITSGLDGASDYKLNVDIIAESANLNSGAKNLLEIEAKKLSQQMGVGLPEISKVMREAARKGVEDVGQLVSISKVAIQQSKLSIQKTDPLNSIGTLSGVANTFEEFDYSKIGGFLHKLEIASGANLENVLQSMKAIAPIAKLMGLSKEQAASFITSAGNNDIEGSEVATASKNFMFGLLEARTQSNDFKNMVKANPALREQYEKAGIDLKPSKKGENEKVQAARGLGFDMSKLTDIKGQFDMKYIIETFQKAKESLPSEIFMAHSTKLFGKEGIHATVTFGNKGKGDWLKSADNLSNSDGVLDNKYKLVADSYKNKVDTFQASFENLKITFVNSGLLDVLSETFAKLSQLITKFENLVVEFPWIGQLVSFGGIILGAFTGISSAILTVGAVLGGLKFSLLAIKGSFILFGGAAFKALMAIGTAFKFVGALAVANPIGLTVMAIAAVIAGLSWVTIKYWDDIKLGLNVALVEFIKFYDWMKGIFCGVWDDLKLGFTSYYDYLTSSFKNIWQVIKSVFNWISTTLGNIWDNPKAGFLQYILDIKEGLTTVFQGLLDKIQPVIDYLREAFENFQRMLGIETKPKAQQQPDKVAYNSFPIPTQTIKPQLDLSNFKDVIDAPMGAIKKADKLPNLSMGQSFLPKIEPIQPLFANMTMPSLAAPMAPVVSQKVASPIIENPLKGLDFKNRIEPHSFKFQPQNINIPPISQKAAPSEVSGKIQIDLNAPYGTTAIAKSESSNVFMGLNLGRASPFD